MSKRLEIKINSEIGELEAVILHKPGKEIENMVPEDAERALYSDILNLSVISEEYAIFNAILNKHAKTFQIQELLGGILENDRIKENLVTEICRNEKVERIQKYLLDLPSEQLALELIEGVHLKKNNLTRYLEKDRYVLKPLHNFFYTRDTSICIGNDILISRMANKVRSRETLIMQAIFDYIPIFSGKTLNMTRDKDFEPFATIEGGDVLVPREDIILIGMSSRTSSQGIDYIIEKVREKNVHKHILVQELPPTPESFIHLDMIFTFLDVNKCMVYEPLILKNNKYLTIHIEIENGQVVTIEKEANLLKSLASLGMELNPLKCGGKDEWNQEREQWHSGANFFALAPGKLIGYSRNTYTLDELNKSGFEILKAKDVLSDKVNLKDYKRYVITIDGSEMARGGGGCRCMTMPVRRKDVKWDII
jgi:arginine deiminase